MKRPKSTEGEGGQQSTAGDKSQTPEGTERYRLNHLMGSTEEHKSEDSPATQARIQDAESTTTTNQQLERQQSAMHAAMNQALKEPLGKTRTMHKVRKWIDNRAKGKKLTAAMVRQMEHNLTAAGDTTSRVAAAVMLVAAEDGMTLEDRRQGTGQQRDWATETMTWADQQGWVSKQMKTKAIKAVNPHPRQLGGKRLEAVCVSRTGLRVGRSNRGAATGIQQGRENGHGAAVNNQTKEISTRLPTNIRGSTGQTGRHSELDDKKSRGETRGAASNMGLPILQGGNRGKCQQGEEGSSRLLRRRTEVGTGTGRAGSNAAGHHRGNSQGPEGAGVHREPLDYCAGAGDRPNRQVGTRGESLRMRVRSTVDEALSPLDDTCHSHGVQEGVHPSGKSSVKVRSMQAGAQP